LTRTVIGNGRMISGRQLINASILIEDGKVKAIGKSEFSQADHTIDAEGKLVLPGLVDGHAHLHDPAFTKREDFTSGTTAAAAGGITSVVEMVLSTPVDSPDRVDTKIAEGRRRSIIDFSLHAGMMN